MKFFEVSRVSLTLSKMFLFNSKFKKETKNKFGVTLITTAVKTTNIGTLRVRAYTNMYIIANILHSNYSLEDYLYLLFKSTILFIKKYDFKTLYFRSSIGCHIKNYFSSYQTLRKFLPQCHIT